MLEIVKESNESAGLVADRRLWLNRKDGNPVDGEHGGKLVEDGDPAAAFLLACGPGDVIPQAKADELGLYLLDGKVVQRGSEVSEEPPAAVANDDGAVL